MDHIDDELLELYALDRVVAEPQLVALEEHLLLCPFCQNQLAGHREYIQQVRAGLQQLASEPQRGVSLNTAAGQNDGATDRALSRSVARW